MKNRLRDVLNVGAPICLLWMCGGYADCATPSAVRLNGWVELSATGKFSLKAPPGSRLSKRAGKDSSVVVFVTPKAELLSDYGAYSNPLGGSGSPADYVAQPVRIDGREARLVTWDAGVSAAPRRYFIGVHFPNLRQSSIGPVKLTIETFVADKSDYELVKTIVGTIRFSN